MARRAITSYLAITSLAECSTSRRAKASHHQEKFQKIDNINKKRKVMKDKINNITKTGRRLGFATIIALCIAFPVCFGTSAYAKPAHGGGGGKPGGGGSGGGTGGGSTNVYVFYSTVTNATQLAGDINYINQYGGTYTIYLQPNTTFIAGPLSIGAGSIGHLTIIGNGDTLDGGNAYRLFTVSGGSSLTLVQMTLQNGYVYASYGGAIGNSGNLTISNCTLSGNTAVDSDYLASLQGGGGAIWNVGGTVIIDNSVLVNNLATGGTGMGGAIYNYSGTVTISNSTLSGNVAAGGNGAVGGAILNAPYSTATVTLINSTLSGNTASCSDAEDGYAIGGGVCNSGGGTLTISGSSVAANTADSYGGGIFNSGTETVENSSKITGNTVDDMWNSGTLYLQGGSMIGTLDGNAAISF
jgi:hypothetical protein